MAETELIAIGKFVETDKNGNGIVELEGDFLEMSPEIHKRLTDLAEYLGEDIQRTIEILIQCYRSSESKE